MSEASENVAAIAKLLHATERATAASIAGGIIAASARPHSVDEALRVLRDVTFAMYPAAGNSRYDTWKRESTTDKPHK